MLTKPKTMLRKISVYFMAAIFCFNFQIKQAAAQAPVAVSTAAELQEMYRPGCRDPRECQPRLKLRQLLR